ncbi:MAG: tRNA-specific 2-thiouridylase [Parcubacteria bacterium C7867-005]|nr:MAG: tRNA-specific 2-thiouridylase [Parcubacteria bacterium C7867-005]
MNISKTKQNISGTKSHRPRVFVGLSGGVDSAVSAALLKDQGFDVTGVFIKVWSPDFLPCPWQEERRDAMRVAAHLDIPFLFFDFEKEYKEGVAEYMINEYKAGRTPNPDVMCNQEIKFGIFFKKAMEMGADCIATGHYARVIKKDNSYLLYEGRDTNKDQSYFLWTIQKNLLGQILFPIGNLKKDEVRVLAKKLKLPVADKKDSQGICFLGDISMEDFLHHFIPQQKGEVLNSAGEVIGQHRGAIFYTSGERHGFTIIKNKADSNPNYIISRDIDQNTITVSDDPVVVESSKAKKIRIVKANWIHDRVDISDFKIEARIRYRQTKFNVNIEGDTVSFYTHQTIASGQSIVFYHGEECLGGAVIDSILE